MADGSDGLARTARFARLREVGYQVLLDAGRVDDLLHALMVPAGEGGELVRI